MMIHENAMVPAADGKRLVALREALGMSQRELAAEFQVTGGAIAHWESGRYAIPGPALRLLALYESELHGKSHRRENLRLASTTNITALGLATATQVLFASSPRCSMQTRIRDLSVAKYVEQATRTRGLAMKWAQFLWGLAPILSQAQRDALRALDTRAPIMSAARAASVFCEEFGVAPSSAFAAWSPRPFASASLGQVHRAKLQSGEDVAVKIQHPDALARMTADLEQLRALDRAALVFLRKQTPGVIHDEVRARYLEECDYRIEAKNQRWMMDTFADHPSVRVPKVIEPFSSRRVLTSTFVDGSTLDEFARTRSQAERDRAGAAIWRFHIETILAHGVFNADPNPGNFLFAEGAVAFLDHGRVKRLSPPFHECWKRAIKGVLERDELAVKQAMIDAGYVKDPATFDFRPALAVVWACYWPCLVDRPFEFTPAYLNHIWQVYVSDTTRMNSNLLADMTFLPRLMTGTIGLLATLGARVHCREQVLRHLYPQGSGVPAPYSDIELRYFGCTSVET